MSDQIDWIALAVFVFFFALVTVMGFFAARWKSGPVSEHLDEWGLGGRQFGTWITWFLVGGDFYTAYTVIAVLRLALYHYRLPLRLCGDAAIVDGGARQGTCHGG
jgi:SSS family solute:Na+ symporter